MYTYTRSRTLNETSLSSFFYLSLYPGAKLTLSGAIAYIEPAGRAFWNSKSLCLYNCLNSKKRETLISPFLVEGLGFGEPLLVIKKDESAFSIQSPTLFRTVKYKDSLLALRASLTSDSNWTKTETVQLEYSRKELFLYWKCFQIAIHRVGNKT